MNPKVLAIRTDFKHHGEDYGYKQILKYTQPFKVIGLNERDENQTKTTLKKKYQWLFEFEAFKWRKKIDLIHILYGEDYFRWSGSLFKKIPIVVTFHQPAKTLKQEVQQGNIRGRIGKLTHLFNKKRFSKLAAAIVTNPAQIDVLKEVMPIEKIHYIPLGIHVEDLNTRFQNRSKLKHSASKALIITVGNWMRDWLFYEEIVKKCFSYDFVLVNRNMDIEILNALKKYNNFKYCPDITDAEMYELYFQADLQFLPVTGIAGSNAFLQGLALGCPVLVTNVNSESLRTNLEIISFYQAGNIRECKEQFQKLIDISPEKKLELQVQANNYVNEFSWKKIAEKTVELYKNLL